MVEVLGCIGAVMILVAYVLNVTDKVDDDNPYFLGLNFIGAILTFYSAYVDKSYPFMIMEGAWILTSAWGLYIYITRDLLKIKK